jgi:hypothetical protein
MGTLTVTPGKTKSKNKKVKIRGAGNLGRIDRLTILNNVMLIFILLYLLSR